MMGTDFCSLMTFPATQRSIYFGDFPKMWMQKVPPARRAAFSGLSQVPGTRSTLGAPLGRWWNTMVTPQSSSFNVWEDDFGGIYRDSWCIPPGILYVFCCWFVWWRLTQNKPYFSRIFSIHGPQSNSQLTELSPIFVSSPQCLFS